MRNARLDGGKRPSQVKHCQAEGPITSITLKKYLFDNGPKENLENRLETRLSLRRRSRHCGGRGCVLHGDWWRREGGGCFGKNKNKRKSAVRKLLSPGFTTSSLFALFFFSKFAAKRLYSFSVVSESCLYSARQLLKFILPAENVAFENFSMKFQLPDVSAELTRSLKDVAGCLVNREHTAF